MEPAAAVPISFGLLLLAGESGSVAVIWGAAGAVVSTWKLREAGVGSVLPAGSVALTSKLWLPSARLV